MAKKKNKKAEKKKSVLRKKKLGRRKINKREKGFNWEWVLLIIVVFLIVLMSAYLVLAYYENCWPFKQENGLEKKVAIRKEVSVNAARVNWDGLQILSDEKISDTDDEQKKIVSSSWAPDSLRLIYLDEDKSLESGMFGYPWKGKLYRLDDGSTRDLANFFPSTSDSDLKWIGQSDIAVFNNERALIETDFNGDNLMKMDLDGAVSYDLSGDGRWLALVKEDGEFIIKNLKSGETRSLGKDQSFINPRWSHDSSKIALLKKIDGQETYKGHENVEIGYISSDAESLLEFNKVGVTYIPGSAGVNVDMVWSNNDRFLMDKMSSNVYSVDPAKTLIANDGESWKKMFAKLSLANDKILVREFRQDKLDEGDARHVVVNLYVMNLDGSKRIELLHKEGDSEEKKWLLDIDGAWSSDGEKIIYNSEGKIFMVGADGTDLRKLTNEDKGYKELQWSNDGKKIAYIVGNEVRLIKLGTEEDREKKEEKKDVSIESDEKLVESDEEEYLEGSTFSPDNKNILYERFAKETEDLGEPPIFYYVANLESKESKKISDEVYSLSGSYKTRWMNDDVVVYDNLDEDGLWIDWVTKGAENDERMHINEWNQNWFGWDISDDGEEIVMVDSNNKIYLHKKGRVDGKIIYEGDPKETITWVRWSPDKKYIVLLKGEKDVWLLRLEGDNVVENKRLGENIVFGRDGGFDPETVVLWSPDSKKVIVQDSGSVFDVDQGLLAQELLPYFSVKFDMTPVAFDYEWSPDSRLIGYRQDNNLYAVKPDGSDKKTLAEGKINCFDWDSDSGRVFYADDKGLSVVNSDGSDSKRLIEKDGEYTYIKVSNDGEKLVYIKDGDVYLVKLKDKD